MTFEWDEAKRAANLAKHGIDFIDAVRAFEHRMLVMVDDRKDYGETRYRGIGFLEPAVILMVWTERAGAIRLVSARRANAKERAYYEATE